MVIDKICRCCLALNGPLLSIYDGGSAASGCVADMLKDIAKLRVSTDQGIHQCMTVCPMPNL